MNEHRERRDVLEHNLARLLRTSYEPARPAPQFVERLERRLEPWLGDKTPQRSLRPWLVGAALAAAAAVLFFVLPRFVERVEPREPQNGHVVVEDGGAKPTIDDDTLRPDAIEHRAADATATNTREDRAAIERTPLAPPADAENEAISAPNEHATAPTTSTLLAHVTLPAGTQSTELTNLRVVFLRAVPLPAVAWPVSRNVNLEDGDTLQLDGLEPGTYLVQVLADGFAPTTIDGVVLGAGASLDLDFTLTRGIELAGHVVDAETGAPLAGALVVSESDAPVQILATVPDEIPSEVRGLAFTGPDGRFVLTGVAPGAQRLRASHPERAPSWLDVDGVAGDVLFELGAGGSLGGRVEDEHGEPLVGARVVASHFTGSDGRGRMTYASALTDTEGRYTVPCLAPGNYAVLDLGVEDTAPHEDLRPRFALAAVQDGVEARVDFLAPLDRPTFAGRVLHIDGRPVERGVVQLVPRTVDGRWRGEQGMISTAVEPDGTFVITGRTPGFYAVYTGGGDDTVLREVLELPASGRVERTYRLGGAVLEGRAFSEVNDTPLARATIVLRSLDSRAMDAGAEDLVAAKAWTASDGSFRIEHLEPGRYRLFAFDDGLAHAFVVVDELVVPLQEPLELRAVIGGGLALTVIDAATSEFVMDARFEVTDPMGRALGDMLDARTDESGRVRWTRLEPGRWTLVAVRGERRSAPVFVDVVPGEERIVKLVLPTD